MVQKKGPDIRNAAPGTRIRRSEGEGRHPPSPRRDQDSETKGVAGLRKKLKKARSAKRISELEDLGSHLGRQCVPQHKKPAARKKKPSSLAGASEGFSPNYMKPTTSSDARKESLMVSFHASTVGDKRGSPETPNRSSVSSSFTASSSNSSRSCNNKKTTTNNNMVKALSRRSSLKLVSPLRKKTLGAPLFPNIIASRATCSSTIKDSRFPKELELSPGATESDGTSAMRVCPYTYCSLNGHRHEALPPLKSFVSTRRRLLKTQKSVRLKGVPSFRRRGSGKGDKRVTIPPPTDEADDDFFVEIFAKLPENTAELAFDQGDNTTPAHDDVDEFPGNFSEITSVGVAGKPAAIKFSVGSGDGCRSEISSEGNPKQRSGSSGSVLEFPAIEYIECDNQVEREEVEFMKGHNDGHSEFRRVNESDEIRGLEESEVQDLVADDVQDLFVVGDDLEYLDDGSLEERVEEIVVDNQARETAEDNGTYKNSSNCSDLYVSECEDPCPDKEGLESIEELTLEEQSQEAAAKDNVVQDEDEHVGNETLVRGVLRSDGAAHKQEAVTVPTAVGVPRDEIPGLDAEKKQGDENGEPKSNDSYSLVCMGIEGETANPTNLEPECIQEMDGNKANDVEVAERGLEDENSKIEELKAVEDIETENEEQACHFFHGDKKTKNENAELEGMTCTPEIPAPDHGLIEGSPSIVQGNEANSNPKNESPTCDAEVMAGLCHEWDSLGNQLDNGSICNDAETRNETSKVERSICIPELLASDHSLIETNSNISRGNETIAESMNEAPTCDEEVIAGLCHESNSLKVQLGNDSFNQDTETKNENDEVAATNCIPKILVLDQGLVEVNPIVNQENVIQSESKKEDSTCDEEATAGLCHECHSSKDQLDNGRFNKGTQTEDENGEVEGSICVPEVLFPDHSLVEANPSITQRNDTDAEPKNEAWKCDEEFMAGLCHECNSLEDQLDNGSFKGNGDKSEIGRLDEDNISAINKSTSTSKWVDGIICGTQMDNVIDPDEYEECLFAGPERAEESVSFTDLISISSSILSETDAKLKSRYTYTRKIVDDDQEELKPFNPRAPNFLPVEPDPGAEKVDLKHQMMDDRKNSEEWMIDYALQRVVSRLAPARKRKVELLVEAFETVAPEDDNHGSTVLAHARPIQACS